MSPKEAWTDFGQKVDLTARLREILINYPEGTSILKEMVQNGDDARATTISFCLDQRSHPTASLLGPLLADFQGPALLVHNNSVFTEQDFESISQIGDSVKRSQAGKTGRFGIGFNSIYHLTDLPSFVSGRHLVIFDPHCKHIPNISSSNPGKKIDLISHPEAVQQFRDQLTPYQGAFGCNPLRVGSPGEDLLETAADPWPSTLFRFPLRSDAQAQTGSISKQVYTVDRAMDLLQALQDEAPLMMLFLKNIARIQVYHWGEGQQEPTLTYCCATANGSAALMHERSLFARVSALALEAATAASGTPALESPSISEAARGHSSVFPLHLTITDHINHISRDRHFLISQVAAGGAAAALATKLSKDFSVPLVPWGAVAAELTVYDQDEPHGNVPGQAFCFLPLPCQTGLPVHINGFFELSSNRRDIWYGSDLTGAGAQRAEWNLVLLEQAIAPAYATLIEESTMLIGPGMAFDRLFPFQDVAFPWQAVVPHLYRLLSDRPVAWTDASILGQDGGRWLSPFVCLMPDEIYRSNAEKDRALHGALVRCGLPLICQSPCIIEMIKNHMGNRPASASPDITRTYLHQHPLATAQCIKEDIPSLLMYCLSDIIPSGASDDPVIRQLLGLSIPFLPLLDGSVATLQRRSLTLEDIILIPDELESRLFGDKAKHLFLDTSRLCDSTTAKLMVLADSRESNLGLADAHVVSRVILPLCLPDARMPSGEITWNDVGGTQEVSRAWAELLWQWLSRQPPLSFKCFYALPILPVQGRRMVFLADKGSASLAILHQGSDWSEEERVLRDILIGLGCHIVDTSFPIPVTDLLSSHVHPFTSIGVLEALWALRSMEGKEGSTVADDTAAMFWDTRLAQLGAFERNHLRQFLLSERCLKEISDVSHPRGERLCFLLKELPIYLSASCPLRHLHCPDDFVESAEVKPKIFTSLIGDPFIEPPGFDASSLLACYVALCKTLAPVLATPKYVRVCDRHPADRDLLSQYLGVKTISASDMFTQHLLVLRVGLLPSEIRDNAFLQILKNLSSLNQVDSRFSQVIQSFPFVPNEKGELCQPCSLYDPRNLDLVTLLDLQTSFPSASFCLDPAILPALQHLGLRQQPGLDTFLMAARYVERLGKEASESQIDPERMDEAVARGKALLAYLELDSDRIYQHIPTPSSSSTKAAIPGSQLQRPGVLSSAPAVMGRLGLGLLSKVSGIFGSLQIQGTVHQGQKSDFKPGCNEDIVNSFWLELSRIRWCPSLASPPELVGIPWPELLSSESGKILETSLQRDRLSAPRLLRPATDMWMCSSCLGILDGECRSSSLSHGLGWSLPLSGSVLASQLLHLGQMHSEVHDESIARVLAGVVPMIYSALSELSDEEFEPASAILHGKFCVWVGNGFSKAKNVALKGSLDLSPWLFVIPSDLAPFRSLLQRLGATQSFSRQQYSSVLRGMMGLERIRENHCIKPLEEKLLSQAIAVIQALAELGPTAGQTSLEDDALCAPDETGRLSALSELAFNDAPWLGPGAGHSAVTPKGFRLIHPLISNLVAERVGVISLRRLLILRSSDALVISAVVGSATEAFGQSEALTTRLRNIISDYPEGAGIMLELLQNADDAGATEVAMMLDATSYSTDSTLGASMSPWQGPALLAFNNAVFSPEDYHNISRIGQDSKLRKLGSIGRFGLGFNIVYNLTDLPSFVSGDHLVAFDPHARYLPGVSPSQPGLKVNFRHAGLLHQFPDAAKPYLAFGCNMHDYFKGTLFRFPLRAEITAMQSEIKPVTCTPEQIMDLFHIFREQLPSALIFLKHVRKVSVWSKSQDGSPSLLFESKAEPSLDRLPSSRQQAPILQFVNSPDRVKRTPSNTICHVRLDDVPCDVGFLDLSCSSASPGLLNRNEDGSSNSVWMVCNSLGRGKGLDKLLLTQGTAGPSKMVPWVGVAAMISNNFGSNMETLNGKAFCFLPLPISTGLPVHINGLFELSTNRRDLWHGEDVSGSGATRAKWNETLMTEAIAPAYGQLLVALSSSTEPEDLYRYFPPKPAELQAPFSLLSSAFYATVIADLSLFWTNAGGGKWEPMSQVLFADDMCHQQPGLKALLMEMGLPIVCRVPRWIELTALETEGVGGIQLTPSIVRQHLRRWAGLQFSSTSQSINDFSQSFDNILMRSGESDTPSGQTLASSLLEYLLADFEPQNDADGQVHASSSLVELSGLPVLPLSGGGFGTLSILSDTLELAQRAMTYLLLKTPLEHRVAGSVPHVIEGLPQSLLRKLASLADSGVMNIRSLTVETLDSIVLPTILPHDWRHTDLISWNPSSVSVPNASWLSTIWEWMRTLPSSSLLPISWPLLPVKGNRLVMMKVGSRVILDGGWMQSVSEAFELLDLLLLDQALLDNREGQDPSIRTNHAPEYFIQKPTLPGVLSAISSVSSSMANSHALVERLRCMNPACCRQFRAFLLQAQWFTTPEGRLTDQQMSLLKSLPIFEAHRGQSQDADPFGHHAGISYRFCALDGPDPVFLPPAELILEDVMYPSCVLQFESSQEEYVVEKFLGIARLNVSEYMESILVKHMSEFPVEAVTRLGVQLVRRVQMNMPSPDLLAMKSWPVIPTPGGKFVSSKALYDPRSKDLREILDPLEHFPGPPYANDDALLDTLVVLGMTERVALDTLVVVASDISSKYLELRDMPNADDDISALVLRSRRLLTLLDEAASSHKESSDISTWSKLLSLSFCPVLQAPPHSGLPWPSSLPRLSPPRLIRPQADSWLVSSTMHVLEAKTVGPALIRFLGWSVPPRVAVLVAQLLQIGQQYGEDAVAKHGNDTTSDNENTGFLVLTEAMHALYSQLMSAIEGPDADLIQMALGRQGTCTVWAGQQSCGRGFLVPADCSVLNSDSDFRPWIITVPSEFHKYSRLLSLMGVNEVMVTNHYIVGLKRLSLSIGHLVALDDNNLDVALRLARGAAQSQYGQLSESPLLPDSERHLIAANQLFFNDADWLDTSDTRLSHPGIDQPIAEALGVRSLRYHHEVDANVALTLPCPTIQQIRGRLSAGDRPCLSLLWELLELADLLGSPRFHLMLDHRHHQAQSLLHAGLASYQGPALCVVMPEVTLSTDELCELMAPRPAGSPLRVRGRAASFNALGLLGCFSVTEVTQAVSGSSTVMWDPSGRVLVTTTAEASRLDAPPRAKQYRHAASGSDLLTLFEDQYRPWDFALYPEGLDIKGHVGALLLRLPLSGQSSGLWRGPGQRDTLVSEVEACLLEFRSRAPQSLLFCRRVQEISIRHLRDPIKSNKSIVDNQNTEGSTVIPQEQLNIDDISHNELQPPLLPLPMPFAEPDPRMDVSMASNPSQILAYRAPQMEVVLHSSVRPIDHANPRLDPHPTRGADKQDLLGSGALGKHLHVIGKAAGSFLGGSSSPLKPSGSSHMSILEITKTGISSEVSAEQWLVSSTLQAAAGDMDMDTVSSVAFQIIPCSSSGQQYRGALPSGLFSGPCPLPLTGSTEGRFPPASALGYQPFLVSGQFYLTKHLQLMIQGQPVVLEVPLSGDTGLDTLKQRQHSHNIMSLDCVSTSWLAALRMCLTGSIRGVTDKGFAYSFVPNLSSTTTIKEDMLAFNCLSKMLSLMSTQPLFLLGSGRFTHLENGCFNQSASDGEQRESEAAKLGSAGQAFIEKELPLFNIPWAVKASLEAAGANPKAVSPAVIRPMLRALFSRGSDHHRNTSGSSTPAITIEQSGELLRFCMSDLERTPIAADSGTLIPRDGSMFGTLSSLVSSVTHVLDSSQQHFAAWHAPVGQDPFQPRGIAGRNNGAAREGLFEIGTAAMAAAVSQVLGHQTQISGTRTEPTRGPSTPGIGVPSTPGTTISSDISQSLDPNKLIDCRGLPVLTAAGSFVSLGSRKLWILPATGCGQNPTTSLPSEVARDIMHPKLVEVVEGIIMLKQSREALGLSFFSTKSLSSLLQSTLPAQWFRANLVIQMDQQHPRDPSTQPGHPRRFGFTGSLQQQRIPERSDHISMRWDRGAQDGSPSSLWLLKIWELISGLILKARAWGAEDEIAVSDLSGWPLIPVNDGQDLVFVAYIHLVVNPSHTLAVSMDGLSNWTGLPPSWELLLSALQRSGVPIMAPDFASVIGPLCGPPLDVDPTGVSRLVSIIAAVDRMLPGNGLRVLDWTAEEKEAMFSVLVTSTPPPGTVALEDIVVLLKLPIYPTALSATMDVTDVRSRTALDAYAGYVSCPWDLRTGIPGLVESLPDDVSRLLLDYNPDWKALLDLLNIPILDVTSLLSSIVLPNLQFLSVNMQMTVLTKILADWLHFRSNPILVSALQCQAFVLASNGMQYKPTELYDPSHPLLALVFKDCPVFPHGTFNSPAWMEVLRCCGLMSNVDTSTFILAAKKLEEIGANVSSMDSSDQAYVLGIAEALFNHLRNNVHQLNGKEFLEQLGSLSIVPAYLGIPGSRSAQLALFRYSEVAMLKDWRLCWTVLPWVHPERAPPEAVAGHLRIKSPPPMSAVLQHMRKVGAGDGDATLCNWPSSAGPVEEAFGALLEHVHAQGLNPKDLEELKVLPLIPVANGTRLASINHLYTRVPLDLSPFAFEVPALLSSKTKILRAFGMKDEVSAQGLIEALMDMAHRSGNNPLNANECNAIVNLLKYVSSGTSDGMLKATGGQNLSTLKHTIADLDYIQKKRSQGILPVISASCRLIKASHGVYYEAGDRSIGQAHEQLQLVHPKVPAAIAAWLGCLRLSDVMRAVLMPSFVMTELQELPGISLQEARALISSPGFVQACLSVVTAHTQLIPRLSSLSLQQVASVLRAAANRLIFVEEIWVCQEIMNGAPPVTVKRREAASSTGTRVFEFSCPQAQKLLIAKPPLGISTSWLLAQILSKELGSPMMLPLQPFIEAGLDKGEVDILSGSLRAMLLPGGHNSDLDKVLHSGQLGAPLLRSDECMMQLKPLRRYFAGEVVAVKRQDLFSGLSSTGYVDAASLAATAAELRMQRADGNLSDSGNQMIYARVAANCSPPEGQTLYHVPLEAGNGEIMSVLSTQVYYFQNSAGVNNQPTDTFSVGPPTQNLEAARGSSRGLTQVQPVPAIHGPLNGNAGDVLGPGQFVSAVQDLLSAAGLPLDLERLQLLNQAASLKEALTLAERKLDKIEAQALLYRGEAETARQSWQCRVCFSADVDCAFTSCGHLFCFRCASSLAGRCAVCRRSGESIRVYK